MLLCGGRPWRVRGVRDRAFAPGALGVFGREYVSVRWSASRQRQLAPRCDGLRGDGADGSEARRFWPSVPHGAGALGVY